ncbi:unnamed protein product [Spirodela intermedia]|uniref:Uncharacterized protein n=1 Tax=Spirodela intermedia TaxID=51605 RepID=A0A7I8KEL4_SPIIN|nr:unnamed protein product [Spirodela intermedia]
MKNTSLSSKLAQLMILLVLSPALGFDFIYFLQQWPGSLCDTMKSCCYPTTGKPPADFRIHGLWPNNADGTYLSFYKPEDAFDITKKHGTCSESVLDQRQYFETALCLKREVDLLGVLQVACKPHGGASSFCGGDNSPVSVEYMGPALRPIAK